MGKYLLEASNIVKLSHWPDSQELYTSTGGEGETNSLTGYEASRWDTGSIDLATLADEESRPSTPMIGRHIDGNIHYDDIEDLMLSWTEGRG